MSPQNKSVHYRQVRRYMTDKVYRTFVRIANITKVCVQNLLRVLECKLEDVKM